ncbi:MAG: hypothetical protein QOE90_3379 [Thermoplasmata archaeon]|jgi:hypothetical protein|nr:hypothetical protein [Thermoplasmata archaeon]
MEGDTRRTLSLVVLGLSALVLVAGVALFALRGGQDRNAFLGLIVVVLLLGTAEAYLVFGGRAARPGRETEEYLLADEAPVLDEDVYEIRCGTCGTQFRVADTLVRPLMAHCPVCGAEGIVPLAAPAASPQPQPKPQPVRIVKLRCPRCQTVNAVEDTGQRPLRTRCTGCNAPLGLR